MEVLSWKSPALKHISEKISFRPMEFPGKVAHQRNSLLDRNRLALFQNSCSRIPYWIRMSLPCSFIGYKWCQGSMDSVFIGQQLEAVCQLCPYSRLT